MMPWGVMSKSKKKKNIIPNTHTKSTSPKSNLVKTEIYQSGPLPAPEQLEKYNRIIPNAAERIVKMAEDGFSHIHEIERDTVKAINEERR